MIPIKKITTFLASLVVVGIILNISVVAAEHTTQQPNFFCIHTYEELIKQTEEKEMVLAWAGVNRLGLALWFFVNDTDWSVFFKDRTTSQYCTAPGYYGPTVNAPPAPVED